MTATRSLLGSVFLTFGLLSFGNTEEENATDFPSLPWPSLPSDVYAIDFNKSDEGSAANVSPISPDDTTKELDIMEGINQTGIPKYGGDDYEAYKDYLTSKELSVETNRLEADPSYERRFALRDVKYKMKLTLQTYLSMVSNYINVSMEWAMYKWHHRLPVIDLAHEKYKRKIYIEQADTYDAPERAKLMMEDVWEVGNAVQYSLFSDWNARRYINNIKPLRNINITSVMIDINRLQDYFMTVMAVVDEYVDQKYCMQVAGTLMLRQKRRCKFKEELSEYTHYLTFSNLCKHYPTNPMSSFRVITDINWLIKKIGGKIH